MYLYSLFSTKMFSNMDIHYEYTLIIGDDNVYS